MGVEGEGTMKAHPTTYHSGESDSKLIKEDGLVMPKSVTGPTTTDEGTPPSAWFVLYRQGTDKDHEWRMISEVLIAHDTDELLERVFDRYPGTKQATKVKFIPADSGIAYNTTWEREE